MDILTYGRARGIVLAVGTVIIAVVTLTAYQLGADPVEVLATGLLIPILLGLTYRGVAGGLVSAAIVSVLYLTVRFSTLAGLDQTEFIPSAIGRVVLYLAVGALGGGASGVLERSMRKLELYDEVDDATGVGNARAALDLTSKEQARAQRYGSVFSVAQLTIDHAVFAQMRERSALRLLRRFLQQLDHQARANDGVARVTGHDHEDVIVVLPETGSDGVRIFAARLLASAREQLAEAGPAAANGGIRVRTLTIPGDDEELAVLRDEMARTMAAETLAGSGEA